MSEIQVRKLRKAFGDFVAVQSSSFTIHDGEFFVMLGPSGCGKTTTLRMIAGLELPTTGEILLDGEDVSFLRASQRDIAFVFQLFALYPHMNVRKNLAFPLKCIGAPAAEIRQRVEETARLLRIDHLLDLSVSGLSGGDRQRVALGRAIIRRPKAFLMDEPLGALDAEFRNLMCQELKALHDRIDATTVYVTHDQLEAMAMADRIAVMNHGIIEQLGAPSEIYNTPASMYVADFIGSPSMNLLTLPGSLEPGQGVLELGSSGMLSLPRCLEGAAEGNLVLGVRPEHLVPQERSPLCGSIRAVEYMGTTQILTVQTEWGPLLSRVRSDLPFQEGEVLSLGFEPHRASLFDASHGRALNTERAHG
jgi:multiple sugar transport system ATP-binding protein